MTDHALSITDLKVTSPSGRLLLSVPRLKLPAGALVAVRGPSGAGKSTLLHALSGLADSATGRVTWGETDVLTLSSEARTAFRATSIGMIFQDFLLFEELDAIGNAGLAALYRPRAERAALRQSARAHLDRLGVDPHADRRVDSFSGGERQRVAIARALSTGAPILLADEPTASLDRATADRLTDDLIALARDTGTTLIAVSHDQALIDRMDRVLTIDGGRITHDESRA